MQSGAESGGKATGKGIFDPIDILGSDFELALAVLGKFIWGATVFLLSEFTPIQEPSTWPLVLFHTEALSPVGTVSLESKHG